MFETAKYGQKKAKTEVNARYRLVKTGDSAVR